MFLAERLRFAPAAERRERARAPQAAAGLRQPPTEPLRVNIGVSRDVAETPVDRFADGRLDPDGAVNHVGVLAIRDFCELPLDFPRLEKIVRVEELHPFAARLRQCVIPRMIAAAMLHGNHANFIAQTARDLGRPIGGPVIDHDDFGGRPRLRERAFEAGAERALRVEAGNGDGDEGLRHGSSAWRLGGAVSDVFQNAPIRFDERRALALLPELTLDALATAAANRGKIQRRG